MNDIKKSIIRPVLDDFRRKGMKKSYKNYSEQYKHAEEYIIENIPVYVNKIFENDMEEYVAKYVNDNFITRDIIMIQDNIFKDKWYEDKNSGAWDYYKRYLSEEKGFSDEGVNYLDGTTTQILNMMEKPSELKEFNTRGLVFGDVQSGKTANFIGAIAKAHDSGYKFIVVLSGMTNVLRSQTQERLETDLVGYVSNEFADKTGNKNIGISLGNNHYFRDVKIDFLTTRESDFSKNSYRGRTLNLEDGNTKIICVKKNVSSLKNVLKGIKNSISFNKEVGKVENCPILIIDDECDQATINTNKKFEDYFDNNGRKIEQSEVDPTSINKNIRSILEMFKKNAYVGYSATPYGNLFIDNEDRHGEYGEDLFPRDFILSLKSSADYTGYEEYTKENSKGLIFHNDNIDMDEIESGILKNIVLEFLASATVKSLREKDSLIKAKHSTMMIQVTHLNSKQIIIFEILEELVQEIKGTINNFDYLDDKMIKLYKKILNKQDKIGNVKKVYSIEEFMKELKVVCRKAELVLDNNIARKDRERYGELKYNGESKFYILVGGFTLGRGLTIEGLITTVFARNTKMSDTLSQMGRWYGYRKKYLDLINIYMDDDNQEKYAITEEVNNSLREQLESMNEKNEKPSDYRLMIMKNYHILPTSSNKMRNAKTRVLSFSGLSNQMVKFDAQNNDHNLNLIEQLLENNDNKISQENNGLILNDVDSNSVIKFLEEYKLINNNDKLYSMMTDPEEWIKYIKKLNPMKELTDWTIYLKSNQKIDESSFDIGEYKITPAIRQRTNMLDIDGINSMRIVTSPQDEKIGLDGLEKIDSRKRIRSRRDPKNGLLIIYPTISSQGSTESATITLAVSWPVSKKETKEGKFYANK